MFRVLYFLEQLLLSHICDAQNYFQSVGSLKILDTKGEIINQRGATGWRGLRPSMTQYNLKQLAAMLDPPCWMFLFIPNAGTVHVM